MPQSTMPPAFAQALQHHQAGRLNEAEPLYRQVLAAQPQDAEAWHHLGILAAQTGRPDLAAQLIRQAISIHPHWPEAHYDLGNVLRAKGQVDEAMAAWRQAITLNPAYPPAYNNLGNALKSKGEIAQAIAVFRQAIAANPAFAPAYNSLGEALKDQGHIDQAIPAYQKALALHPAYAEAYYNLGNALQAAGNIDAAIAAWQQAIARKPNFAQALYNLGRALGDRGNLDGAITAYRQAAALNYVPAYLNLGNALADQGNPDEAITVFGQAIALKPDHPEAYNNLGNTLSSIGCADEAIAAYRQAVALKPDFCRAHSNLITIMHSHPGCDAHAIAQELARWNQQHAQPLAGHIRPHANDRNPARRLRIGYLSADFHEHPVARFILPLLQHHDHQAVEVIAYAQLARGDAMTDRLRAHTDAWRNIITLSDAQAADFIRQDRIDILVDLTLHMAGNRLPIFAHKPAPVQVTYLAYAGSSGLTTMDYRLSDPYLDPPGEDESIYSEQTLRLPHTFWCYAPVVDLPLQPPPAVANGYVTFGCLNNFYKVNPPLLDIWADLLATVPQSRLWLRADPGQHRQHLLDHMQSRDIAPTRIHFATRVSMPAYFQQYQSIDIALDTQPYGGGTTTCDALWMGVPVISQTGKTAVGRGGLSILTNIGLPELAAKTPADYVQLATALANDMPRLQGLRAALRQRMQASPLMDAPRIARDVEAAYRQIWRKYCAAGQKK